MDITLPSGKAVDANCLQEESCKNSKVFGNTRVDCNGERACLGITAEGNATVTCAEKSCASALVKESATITCKAAQSCTRIQVGDKAGNFGSPTEGGEVECQVDSACPNAAV